MGKLPLVITLFSVFPVACGYQTNPKPPELIAPGPVANLIAETTVGGVKLRWTRPSATVDGSDLNDLGGFLLMRGEQWGSDSSPLEVLATVLVEDKDRFRKTRRYTYLDRRVLPHTAYRYGIVAFTTDKHFSAPSNIAEIRWEGESGRGE